MVQNATQVDVDDEPKTAVDVPIVQPAALGRDALQSAIDEWYRIHESELDALEFHGLEVAVARPGSPPLVATLGAARITDAPLTPESVWPIGSLTKSFTTTLLARLAEDGVVDMDDLLERWVPEYPQAARVTLRQLANHQSGVPASSSWQSTPDQALSEVWDKPLSFEPGSGAEYSDAGMYLLGEALQRAANVDYLDAVRREIGDRLGLASLTLAGPRWSAGGLEATIGDLVTFAAGLFGSDAVLGEWGRAQLTDFDPRAEVWNAGLSFYPRCPCWHSAEGRLRAVRWGNGSSNGQFFYDERDGSAIAFLSDVFLDPDGVSSPPLAALPDLLFDLVWGREIVSS